MTLSSGNTQTPLGGWGTGLLGAYLIALSVLLAYLLYEVWPRGDDEEITLFFEASFTVSTEIRRILLVMVVGALGSFVHAATSFVDFVGNRSIFRSWGWWYLLRPFIGLSLATIFYFAIRGGLFSADADADDVNPFGVAAMAGLVGMFSKQATDKLREVFDTLFRTEGDDKRKDPLE